MALLQIYQRIYQCKNFEHQLTFGEVTDKSLVSYFFDSPCRCTLPCSDSEWELSYIAVTTYSVFYSPTSSKTSI